MQPWNEQIKCTSTMTDIVSEPTAGVAPVIYNNTELNENERQVI